jgi:AcrR family transcriptional regulator
VSIRRKRLSPEESRSAAIDAARRLLLADGPQAVTLKAVAAEVGRTHANLLHHFGSAAGLQGALARSIADSVTSTIADAVERARSGEADARDIVDGTFDVFDREGAGALAAWMILTGNRDALDPILDSIRGLVAQLSVGHEEHHVAESTLSLVLSALGDSLLGAPIAEALGLRRDTARELAAERLRARLESDRAQG